jgi:phenylacetate-coenzyme A ligase PaaK-like adenylate-forming protein
MIAALNAYQPEALGGDASVIGLLAEEQLQGRLAIAPRVVLTTSEVLTDDAAARIAHAWTKPVQGYFSREVGVIASGSLDHVGLHVCEEAILEVVDERCRPMPPGTAGSKVLLTNLVNRVQPLIRYELSDAVVLEHGPDPSGRPYDRIARIDGRSDDVLYLLSAGGRTVAVNPFRLRAPFVTLLDVLQYQVVHRADGLLVRIVRATQLRAVCKIGFALPLRRRSPTRERKLPCASTWSTRSSASRATLRSSSWWSQRCRAERRIALQWRSRSTSPAAWRSSPAARAAWDGRTR